MFVSGAGPARNNTVTATIAYKTYFITATIVDGSQIVTKTMSVYVKPASAHHCYLESYGTVATGLNLNSSSRITTVTIPSSFAVNTVFDSLYLIIRDR